MKTDSNINFTFKSVYKLVKGSNNDELIDAFNSLFSVGLLLVPTLICKETAALVAISSGMDLIGAKDVISNASKNLVNCIIKKEGKNYREKYERMQMAHVLICFTAFFETIDGLLPDLKKDIGLMESEKLFLTEEAIKSFKNVIEEREKIEISDEILEFSLPFPHPAERYNNHTQLLSVFYEKLRVGFIDFLKCLSLWDDKEEHKKEEILARLKEVVPKAVAAYKHQYFELAISFNEFFVWVNNKEHKDIEQKVDIGFIEINSKINKILENNENSIGIKVFKELSNKYNSIVKAPIIEASEVNQQSDTLFFPSKSEIFIPQQFKALYYTKREKLEDDTFWKSISEKDNLGEFINGLMSHTSSNDFPAIILGHPGSGKSLLCNMLASKILHNRYNVILVKLRSINAENTIVAQIESQISDEIGRKCNWTDIAECNSEKDIVVIFDGYDELLQASGKTYANYIKQIQEFQQNEIFVGRRPVKCLLTSRITLIDKAFIPEGSTIIRLLDFDSTRIDLWTRIWNVTNKEYFTTNDVKPLSIPNDKKLVHLAKQPLLLLMLALFDSNGNQIEKHKELDLTELYYNLITEFIKREKNKASAFKNIIEEEQLKLVNAEVNKVGIAAIGMFNRKTLYIHSEQLNGDIAFFENFSDTRNNGISLTNADLLLGSFFFVYRSNSKEYENASSHDKTAYEFLHNTFGEFLTANFILNSMYDIINKINIMSINKLEVEIASQLNNKWFGTLIYSPLFSRPVVIKMLSEWFPYFIKSKGMSSETFLQNLDTVIAHEIQQITNGNRFNSVMTTKEKNNPYEALSLISHLAIYSLNLIILRCVLSKDKYVLEDLTNSQINGVDKWTKLTQLWKSEFTYENLYILSHFIFVDKHQEEIQVRYINKKSDVSAISSESNQLQLIYNVGIAIGDDFMAGTSGLLLKNFKNYKIIFDCLKRENIEVEVKLILDKLIYEISHFEINYDAVIITFEEALSAVYKKGTKEDLFVLVLLVRYLLLDDDLRDSLFDEEYPLHLIDKEPFTSKRSYRSYSRSKMNDLLQELLDMYFREDRFIKSNFHISLLSLIIDTPKTMSRNYDTFVFDTKIISRYLSKLIEYSTKKFVRESNEQYSVMLAKTLKTFNLLFDEYLSFNTGDKRGRERVYYDLRESHSIFYDNKYMYEILENISEKKISHSPSLLLEVLKLINNLDKMELAYDNGKRGKYKNRISLFHWDFDMFRFVEHEILYRNMPKSLTFEIFTELLKYNYGKQDKLEHLDMGSGLWRHYFAENRFCLFLLRMPKQTYEFLRIINELDIFIEINSIEEITAEWLFDNGNNVSGSTLRELLKYAERLHLDNTYHAIIEYISK